MTHFKKHTDSKERDVGNSLCEGKAALGAGRQAVYPHSVLSLFVCTAHSRNRSCRVALALREQG